MLTLFPVRQQQTSTDRNGGQSDPYVSLLLRQATQKRKIEKGNLYLIENRLSRNEMWCGAENYNYMCHVCAKGLLDSKFN